MNGKQVNADYLLRDGDLIEHTAHWHEPSVLDIKIDIIQETQDLLAINKPAGIPVYPCGRYNHQSVLNRLPGPLFRKNKFYLRLNNTIIYLKILTKIKRYID